MSGLAFPEGNCIRRKNHKAFFGQFLGVPDAVALPRQHVKSHGFILSIARGLMQRNDGRPASLEVFGRQKPGVSPFAIGQGISQPAHRVRRSAAVLQAISEEFKLHLRWWPVGQCSEQLIRDPLPHLALFFPLLRRRSLADWRDQLVRAGLLAVNGLPCLSPLSTYQNPNCSSHCRASTTNTALLNLALITN